MTIGSDLAIFRGPKAERRCLARRIREAWGVGVLWTLSIAGRLRIDIGGDGDSGRWASGWRAVSVVAQEAVDSAGMTMTMLTDRDHRQQALAAVSTSVPLPHRGLRRDSPSGREVPL
jgi:hypothetical protein